MTGLGLPGSLASTVIVTSLLHWFECNINRPYGLNRVAKGKAPQRGSFLKIAQAG